MIKRREIVKIATSKGVPKSTIEKDWILGHFLDAIMSIEELRNNLVFKGGSCLKKCYFKEYRFSEDLDFTSRDPNYRISENNFKEVSGIIQKLSGAQTAFQSFRELRYNDKLTGYEAKIKYWGPDHDPNVPPPSPERWSSNIKVEVTLFEKILFEVKMLPIHHPYSDLLSANPLIVPVYDELEIITEKIRSLVQRSYNAPRDYYDIWYLLQRSIFDDTIIKENLLEKMAIKGIHFVSVDQFFPKENLKAVLIGWDQSLKNQIPGNLPDFKLVETDLRKFLTRIFNIPE
jgi:predicted nucleotidyltransferase component of viral defense system